MDKIVGLVKSHSEDFHIGYSPTCSEIYLLGGYEYIQKGNQKSLLGGRKYGAWTYPWIMNDNVPLPPPSFINISDWDVDYT